MWKAYVSNHPFINTADTGMPMADANTVSNINSLVKIKNRQVLFAPSTLRIPTSFKRDKVENSVTIHNPRHATNTASKEALANIQPKLRSDLYKKVFKSLKKK